MDDQRGDPLALELLALELLLRFRILPLSIRQHPSASASIRQHPSASASIRQHTAAYGSMRTCTSASASESVCAVKKEWRVKAMPLRFSMLRMLTYAGVG
jgi:hypothetical protein